MAQPVQRGVLGGRDQPAVAYAAQTHGQQTNVHGGGHVINNMIGVVPGSIVREQSSGGGGIEGGVDAANLVKQADPRVVPFVQILLVIAALGVGGFVLASFWQKLLETSVVPFLAIGAAALYIWKFRK